MKEVLNNLSTHSKVVLDEKTASQNDYALQIAALKEQLRQKEEE